MICVVYEIMLKMKFIALAWLLMVLIASCNNVKNTPLDCRLSVHAEILLAGDDISCPFDTLLISNTSVLKVSLKNLSGKAVSFWMMNCTWHDSFIFDSDNTDFYRTKCTRSLSDFI